MNLMYSVPTQVLRMTPTIPPIPPSMAGGVKMGSCTDDIAVLTPNVKAPLSDKYVHSSTHYIYNSKKHLTLF